MTGASFLEAYSSGKRHFQNLEMEYEPGLQNRNFSDCIFENCFLFVDFEGSNFTNAQFIQCNVKEIRLVNCNLTNALMKNCLVESAEFDGAITDGFRFEDNYYFGITLGQESFGELFLKG